MRVAPLVVPVLCVSLGYSQTASIPGRETLHYNVEWRLITAGKAHVEWAAAPGARTWQVNFRLESVGLVSKLFKVEDDYTASLNQSLCAQSSHLSAHEGSRRRDTRITFDPETHKASYLERDLLKNTVVTSQEIDVPSCVHDVIGGLYFMRTLNLEPGQSTQIPISDGKRSAMVKVEAQQREEVKVPEGAFRTIRYEAFMFNDVIYRRSAHLYIWLTDDRRKLPVQIRVRMQIATGTVTLQLEKHESQ
jgi:hypothetical protein